jgi:hypothetical protein
MPSTDTKPELTAKASMAQPVSQPAVYASGLNRQVVGTYIFYLPPMSPGFNLSPVRVEFLEQKVEHEKIFSG